MIWKDVVGYEGIYEVSDSGLVRTHKNKTTYSTIHKTLRYWEQRTLKQKVSKDDCHRVELYKNGRGKTWLVHRLVAIAFIPKVKGKEYVNHIDGDRCNNNVENLEWCNHKENNNHAFDTGLMTSNNKIILLDKKTHEPLYFRSMAKASLFLGRNNGYLSQKVKEGKYETKGYHVFISPGGAGKL